MLSPVVIPLLYEESTQTCTLICLQLHNYSLHGHCRHRLLPTSDVEAGSDETARAPHRPKPRRQPSVCAHLRQGRHVRVPLPDRARSPRQEVLAHHHQGEYIRQWPRQVQVSRRTQRSHAVRGRPLPSRQDYHRTLLLRVPPGTIARRQDAPVTVATARHTRCDKERPFKIPTAVSVLERRPDDDRR